MVFLLMPPLQISSNIPEWIVYFRFILCFLLPLGSYIFSVLYLADWAFCVVIGWHKLVELVQEAGGGGAELHLPGQPGALQRAVPEVGHHPAELPAGAPRPVAPDTHSVNSFKVVLHLPLLPGASRPLAVLDAGQAGRGVCN